MLAVAAEFYRLRLGLLLLLFDGLGLPLGLPLIVFIEPFLCGTSSPLHAWTLAGISVLTHNPLPCLDFPVKKIGSAW